MTSPQENLVISVASVADAEVLTTLGITTFLQAFAKDNKKEDMDKYIAEEMNQGKIEEELKDESNVFFLLRYENQPAGYAKMRTIKKPEALKLHNPIEIERIYVLEQYYDKKIGAALMMHCLAHAMAGQHDVVWLGVWEQNHRAVNFYKRWGFDFFGSHSFKLGDDIQTDVLMKKHIQP